MGVHTIRNTGGEPNTWEVERFANISASEEFMQQVMMEMPRLVDAGTIYEPLRQKVLDAIGAISIDGLMPAFSRLKQIRLSPQQKLPELDRKQLYEDFTLALWRGYKDRMQDALLLLGFHMGFLFENDVKFEKGLDQLSKSNSSVAAKLGPDLRTQRVEWQSELSSFRNFLEHRGSADPDKYKHRYVPEHAENVFDSAWRTIADVLAVTLETHFGLGVRLQEIPREERHPQLGYRFQFQVDAVRIWK